MNYVSIKWTLESEISKKAIYNSTKRYKSNKMYIYAENCKTEVEEVKYMKRERERECVHGLEDSILVRHQFSLICNQHM